MKGISIMTDEFFENENVDDDEVVKRIEKTETAREFEKLIEREE